MNLSSIYYLHEIGGKKNQEDYIWPVPGAAMPHDRIFIVCDGVGGAENGEVASRMIAEYAGKSLLQAAPDAISIEKINHILADARRHLLTYAAEKGISTGMATTFASLVLFSDKAFIAWCGDSRVYHIRNGMILYKTMDHSLVSSLVKKGEITEQEALVHPQKHIILKAITGDESNEEAEGHWIHDIAEADYFMLCSDGLLENISDDDLKTLLSRPLGQTDIALAIQEKCFGKTRDNYSMYLLRVSFEERAKRKKTAAKKSKTNQRLIALSILLALVVTGGLFFSRNSGERMGTGIPAGAPQSDSARPQSEPATKKDTILEPGKNTVSDSELLKEEQGEHKIMPSPLPERKKTVDSAEDKKFPKQKSDHILPEKRPLSHIRRSPAKNTAT